MEEKDRAWSAQERGVLDEVGYASGGPHSHGAADVPMRWGTLPQGRRPFAGLQLDVQHGGPDRAGRAV